MRRMPGGHNQFDHIAFSSLEAPIVAPVEVATGTEPSAQQRGLRTMTGLTAILHEDIEEMPRPSGLTDEEYEAGVQHGQTFLDWVDLCVNVLIEGDAETNRQFTFADITELAVTAYGASLHRKLLQGQIARADYHSLTAILPAMATLVCNAFDKIARAEAIAEARLLSALPRQVIPEPQIVPGV